MINWLKFQCSFLLFALCFGLHLLLKETFGSVSSSSFAAESLTESVGAEQEVNGWFSGRFAASERKQDHSSQAELQSG